MQTERSRFTSGQTLLELLVCIAFLCVGAIAGASVAAAIGAIRNSLTDDFVAAGALVGAGVTFVGGFAYAQWFGRMDAIHPPCRCGKRGWQEFHTVTLPGLSNVWECTCGRRYTHPQWRLWYEIQSDNVPTLFLKRNRLGYWMEATEDDIANHRFQDIVAKRAKS